MFGTYRGIGGWKHVGFRIWKNYGKSVSNFTLFYASHCQANSTFDFKLPDKIEGQNDKLFGELCYSGQSMLKYLPGIPLKV